MHVERSKQCVAAVIPALNEAGGIAAVVGRLLELGVATVIVADNGSTDGTQSLAAEAGANVVSVDLRGYGSACAEGLAHVPDDAEWVLFVDADTGEEIEDLPKFFDAMDEQDLILGDRTATSGGRSSLAPVQKFGNQLATGLMAYLHGRRYRDLGPLRLIRREALNQIGMMDRGFGWTVEMQARAADCGLRTLEIPLRPGGRKHGKSKISGTLRGTWRAGRAILATLFLTGMRRVQSRLEGSGMQSVLRVAAAAGLLGGAVLMMPHGDFKGDANSIPMFLVAAGVMSAGYLAGLGLARMSMLTFWGVAIASRVILLPMAPGDDVWRYLWEGWIQLHGFDPYLVAPDSSALADIQQPWTSLMNNRGSTTIYPPFALFSFALVSAVGLEVLLFKLVLVLADILTCLVLVRAFGRCRALAYVWCPLAIYCFAGGAHYDSLFILPLTAALCLFSEKPSVWSALLSGVATAFKWVTFPIIFHDARTAVFQRRFGAAILLSVIGVAPVVLGAAWFSEAFLSGRFYPQKFAMHARSAELLPVYFEHPHPLWAYNSVLRGLIVVVIGAVLLLVTAQRAKFAERWIFVVLILSPLVHAWYFVWLTPFGVITRNLGAILAGVSGFAYFVLHYRIHAGGQWQLEPLEWFVMWMPLIGGYALSLFLNIRRGPPVVVGAAVVRPL